MDRPSFLGLDGTVGEVHRFTENIEHPAQRLWSHRHGDGGAGIDDVYTALHAVGRRHSHGPNPILAQMLLNLGNDVHGALAVFGGSGDPQRVVDGRQLSAGEFYVQHRDR